MSLYEDFETFCKNIQLNNLEDMLKTTKSLARKLNVHYHHLDTHSGLHMYIVGSVGRNTAISGNSDLDLIFDMPKEIYTKYDNYDSNGQSALLQDVKNVLMDKYPNAIISGDGQVVVIEFKKYTIELVPAFLQTNGEFRYPDTHNGGSWKITNPIKEQSECSSCNSISGGIYYNFCRIVRSWKNSVGFKIGGLLIDTLVYNFFQENDNFANYGFDDYLNILISLFKFIKNEDPNRKFWYAVGSNQCVFNSNDGEFVKKADIAYKTLSEINKSDLEAINNAFRKLLGHEFPKIKEETTNFLCHSSVNKKYNMVTNTEQFIEDLVPVDIRFFLYIDCKVSQNGFRPFQLRSYKGQLGYNMQLNFYISKTDCLQPYEIWWKVRNVGQQAIERKMIRGNIMKINSKYRLEHTDFAGKHYVECYLIKNGICVARDRIDVPICGKSV